MSGLFIRLYLDEDVDVLVAEMVRAHGFDALTTREARQLGNSDAAVLSVDVACFVAASSHLAGQHLSVRVSS